MTIAELSQEDGAVQKDQRLVAGRYRLRERIGHGRLGEIYRADDESYRELGVEQQVAIQLLPERVALAPGLFRKLKSGFTLLRTGAHPNIVAFPDFDHDGKFGYLVMDLLEGASLRFILDDMTSLPLDEAIPVIRAVGDALQFLHAKSLVHGKLTAENVFVTDDLDVRLLDIVPLNSAGTPRRSASNDPFSSRDVATDVYGLACLTYEMLAGNHPFNFHTQAEARLAKLGPARINSLSERQWNAIRRGLSFDREERILSVAEFHREFGISGTERLQPSEVETTNQGPSLRSLENDAPANLASPMVRPEEKLEITRAKSKSAKWMPSPVLIIALIALGVWSFYGQPRENVVTLINYVTSYLDSESSGSGNVSLPSRVSDPTPLEESATLPPATETQPSAEDSTGSETADEGPVTEYTVGSGTTSTEPSYPTVAIASPDSPTQASEADAAANLPADEFASTPDGAVPSQSASELTSFVSISERDGAARITAQYPGNAAGTVFWWTDDHTAIAGEDYISVEQPVADFASTEETETLFIPLVNDAVPEPQETFYVYLGWHNAELGRLETILRVRVDINDDD